MITIREYLYTLPRRIYIEAMKNIKAQKGSKTEAVLSEEVSSLGRAIDKPMHWESTPQGHNYWSRIQDQADNNTLKLRRRTL